jgi:hypothetical protein
MGIEKCVQCKKIVDADEIVWVPVDDSHDAPYCVSCSPDDDTSYDYEDN